MFRLLFSKLSHVTSRASEFNHGFCLSSYLLRTMSEMSKTTNPHSLTVSYFQKSCGYSEESAISASRKFSTETPEKSDSFLELMTTHGLTQTHVAKIISDRPGLLSADLDAKLRPNLELLKSLGISGSSLAKMLRRDSRFLECDLHKTVEFFRDHGFSDEQIAMMTMKLPVLFSSKLNGNLKPKLEFFRSLGLTDGDVANMLSYEPYLLQRSLENQIIPSVQVLRRVLGTDLDLKKALKACYSLLDYDLEKTVERNISMLKSHGVPEPLISRIFMIQPRTLLLRQHRFDQVLAEVVNLGFNPNTLLFVLAIRSLATLSKAQWEQKLECYRSYGVSKDQVYLAFRSQPMVMLVSEKKIKKLMDFFIHKLNWEPSFISRYPGILLLSLEKRIIPRSSVMQLLISKGLIKEPIRIITYLTMTEMKFVKNIVSKYQDKLPDVVKAHQGKIEIQEFPGFLKA